MRANIADGKPRAVHFAFTSDEHVLSRVQNDGSSDDPRDYHLFASGRAIAEYTNNANEDVRNYDYQKMINSRMAKPAGSSDFYNGGSATSGGEFGTSGYDPVNPIRIFAKQSAKIPD